MSSNDRWTGFHPDFGPKNVGKDQGFSRLLAYSQGPAEASTPTISCDYGLRLNNHLQPVTAGRSFKRLAYLI